MRLDLDGVGVESQAACFDVALGEILPVHIGIGRQVRVVVAHCAVDLAQNLDRGDARVGAAQAIHDVGHFLAQRAGRGGLAVGTAQQGQVGMLVREMLQSIDQHLQRGQHHRIARILEHERVAQVVDVFRGAGEMDEFQRFRRFRIAGELVAQPVFDGFDVVVGAPLDGLDLLGIGFGELCGELVELRDGRGGDRRQFLDAGFGSQCLEPLDLDQHAVTDQAVFAEIAAQAFNFAVVTSIQWGKCCQCRKSHDV